MGSLACLIAAYLGERDFFLDQEERRLSDIRSRLSVLLDLRTGKPSDARNLSINRSIVSTILKNAKKLEKELGLKPTGTGLSVNDAGTVLAFAYPERIAMAVKNGHGSYKMASGNATFLSPGDPLSLEPMIVCAELDGNRTRSRIFIAAPYSVESLKADFGHDVKKMDVLEWDEKSQAVTAETRQGYGQLVLATEPLGKPDQEAVTDILVSRIMAAGLDVLPWNPTLRTLCSRAVFLKSVEGFDDFPDLSDGALSERLDRWLRPYLTGIRSFAKLRNIDLQSAVMSLLTWNHRNRLDELAPTHLIVPSGSRIPLDYMVVEDRFHTSPVLSVRLQEMFGCMETPRIVKGRIPVTVQLLSPAGRIMQVTKDLESFWKNTYEQVKKDLKGRYPKHYWPDDPFAAIATNKTKKSMDRKS
jgi:ATP-dependent helicase HrpB